MKIAHSSGLTIVMAFLGALLIAVRVGGQATPEPDLRPSLNALEPQAVTIVRTDESGNVIEEQVTGHTNEPTGGPRAVYSQQPWSVPYGGAPYVPDEESQNLFQQEQAAAAEARQLTTQFQRASTGQKRTEAKGELREKLVRIFELQQMRRQREVGQIEERLGKLKDTMKKRNAAKDSIVDRRLEALTGGIDELGWEETGARGPGGLRWAPESAFGYGGGDYSRFAPSYSQPPNAPAAPRAKASTRPARPGQPPQPPQQPQPGQRQQPAPAPAPAPVPVAPLPPALPAPAAPPSASPAAPAVAPPAPPALPAAPLPPAAALPAAPRGN
jgi:hypothetical protein